MSIPEQLPAPDHIAAIIAFLREAATLHGFIEPKRIRGRIPNQIDGNPVQPHTKFVVVSKGTGPRANPYVPFREPRVDIRCYGETEYEATLLWRTIHAYLEPAPVVGGLRNGFIRANCRIDDINLVTDGLELVDERHDNWNYVLTAYRATVWGVPVATA